MTLKRSTLRTNNLFQQFSLDRQSDGCDAIIGIKFHQNVTHMKLNSREIDYHALGSHRSEFDLRSLGKVNISGKAEGVEIWAAKGQVRS